jgi:hypothetical protein
MRHAHFVPLQYETPHGAYHLRVGAIDQPEARLTAKVLVGELNVSFVVDVFANRTDYFFREEAIVWHNWLVIGLGLQITFFNLSSLDSSILRLGSTNFSYFSEIYPTEELLLVASGTSLHCFGHDGALLWKHEDLGLDGVLIDDIKNGNVYGRGEWDPPNGWQPFFISLSTGQTLAHP